MGARVLTLRILIVKRQRNQDQDQSVSCGLFLLWIKSNRTSVVDGAASNRLNFERTMTERRPWESLEDSNWKSWTYRLPIVAVIVLTFDSGRSWCVEIWLLNYWVTCAGCSHQLSLISSWVSIKTAEPAAQTATRQSELWRWFDRTEKAGCAKTHRLFSKWALPQGFHIEEVQLWCVVTSPHKPETQLLILLSDQRQEHTVESMPLSLSFIPLIELSRPLFSLTLSVLYCSLFGWLLLLMA